LIQHPIYPPDTRETIYYKLNIINERLSWINNSTERGGMLGQKRGLEIQLETWDKIERGEIL